MPSARLTATGSRAGAFGVVDWALLVGVALIWGTSFLWIKIALDGFPPGLVALLRLSLGCATVGVALCFLHGVRGAARAVRGVWGPSDRWRVCFLGLMWMGIPLTTLAFTGQWIDSSLSGMLIGSMPLIVACVASASLRRLPGKRQALGLGVGFGGVICILVGEWGAGQNSALGIVLTLCCACCFSLSTAAAVPLQQKCSRTGGPFGFLPVVWSMQAISALACLPVGLYDGLRRARPLGSWKPLAALLVLGAVSTGAGYVCMAALGGRVGPVRGSVPIFFLPAVSLLAGFVVRGEHIAPLGIAGTVLVVAGAVLASRREAAASTASTVVEVDGARRAEPACEPA